MRGMRYVPWFIAAVFWGLTIGTGISGTAADLHGTIDCGTIISSCLLIGLHVPPRLKPGQMIVSISDFREGERTARESIARGHGENCILQEKRNQRDVQDSQPSTLGA